MSQVIATGRRGGRPTGTLRVEVPDGRNQEQEQYEVLRALHASHFADESWPWELVEPDNEGQPPKVYMARAVAQAAGFDELIYAREHDSGIELVRVVADASSEAAYDIDEESDEEPPTRH
ncbi:MAG: hypothetical protein RBS88_03115 [Spongiibacteraceae bacterium]|jgi:hypothetical protein|nr:hypothetical protein [Spongiibacteraceae bacterium]